MANEKNKLKDADGFIRLYVLCGRRVEGQIQKEVW